jgi:uncharacterized repeat protein (TIGR01451 family)
VTTLTFDITNEEGVPASNLAFVDNLPTEITIATPANPISDCGGIVTAPDGGGTISFSGGGVGANSTCSITVNVTSSVPGEGPYNNVSGNLTSSAGNSGPAIAELTVDPSLPGFTKSFSPSSISLGGTSTLTLTIDNSANAAAVTVLEFNDPLPPGMVIASPANASNDCGGVLTAVAGTNTIFFSTSVVGAESSCTITVDVTTNTTGVFVNTTGDLLIGGSGDAIGFATAILDVPFEFFTKSFTIRPGSSPRPTSLSTIRSTR